MLEFFLLIVRAIGLASRGRRGELVLENIALRHQLRTLQRSVKRPHLRSHDRMFWVLLASAWRRWRSALVLVRPDTYSDGIATGSVDVGRPPSQTWRTFLANHVSTIASMDFFTVPTITGRLLFVFIVLSHNRRRILHINGTARPTSAWTAQQLVEAFPDDTAPRWVLRDRDAIYDEQVRRRITSLGITEVVSSPRSPWQNPYVERVIGSMRRECLDHVIVFNERHLRRILRAYVAYYHRSRTHLGLGKDAPDGRACSRAGDIVVTPEVGGLHHRYDRQAA